VDAHADIDIPGLSDYPNYHGNQNKNVLKIKALKYIFKKIGMPVATLLGLIPKKY
jgi:hypothetical protein